MTTLSILELIIELTSRILHQPKLATVNSLGDGNSVVEGSSLQLLGIMVYTFSLYAIGGPQSNDLFVQNVAHKLNLICLFYVGNMNMICVEFLNFFNFQNNGENIEIHTVQRDSSNVSIYLIFILFSVLFKSVGLSRI